MIGFRRASPAIAVLVTTASLLGAPLAHASSLMHSPSNRHIIHAQERFSFTRKSAFGLRQDTFRAFARRNLARTWKITSPTLT